MDEQLDRRRRAPWSSRTPRGWLLGPARREQLGRCGRAVGIPVAELEEQLLAPPNLPFGDYVLIPDDTVYRTVEWAMERAGTEAVLLRGLQARSEEAYDALELAMMASESLAGALRRACRYEAFWSTTVDLDLVRTRSRAEVKCRTQTESGRGRDATTAALLAAVASHARVVTGSRDVVLGARLRWRPTREEEHVGALFGVPVTLGCSDDAITLRAEDLDRRLPQSHKPFSSYFDREVQLIVSRLHRSTDVQRRVTEELCMRLVDGADDALGSVARSLAMSPRTLQRRLAEEGTSFTALMDQVRAGLASEALLDPSKTIGEVAYALGFANPAAFVRAFRRWNGVTPGEHRRRLSLGG